MALQTTKEDPSLASITNTKKKTVKKITQNSLMVEIRCVATLNLLLKKVKKDFIQGINQFQECKPAH